MEQSGLLLPAIDSEMSLALAKPEGQDRLQLFYIKVRNEYGELNNIKIIGLKNKMGQGRCPLLSLSYKEY